LWKPKSCKQVKYISNKLYKFQIGVLSSKTHVAPGMFGRDFFPAVVNSLRRSRSAFLESRGGGLVLAFLAEASPLPPASKPEMLARGRLVGQGAAFLGACSSSSSSFGSSSAVSPLTGTRSMERNSSSAKELSWRRSQGTIENSSQNCEVKYYKCSSAYRRALVVCLDVN
jgi:hypothetical protein